MARPPPRWRRVLYRASPSPPCFRHRFHNTVANHCSIAALSGGTGAEKLPGYGWGRAIMIQVIFTAPVFLFGFLPLSRRLSEMLVIRDVYEGGTAH